MKHILGIILISLPVLVILFMVWVSVGGDLKLFLITWGSSLTLVASLVGGLSLLTND